MEKPVDLHENVKFCRVSCMFSQEVYAKVFYALLNNCGSTVGERSIESLESQYNHSIVMLLGDEVVGHASMVPVNGSEEVGEIESVMINQKYRKQGMGHILMSQLHNILGNNYQSYQFATLHPAMSKIAESLGYQEFSLPDAMRDEGIKFFVETGKMNKEEFLRNAKFFTKSNA